LVGSWQRLALLQAVRQNIYKLICTGMKRGVHPLRRQYFINGSAMVFIRKGTCHLLYAYDIGTAINLSLCPERLTSLGRTKISDRNRRAPKYFDYDPPPLTIIHEASLPGIGKHEVSSRVSMTFYDFGAVSISYEIDFAGSLEDLRNLSIEIAQNNILLRDSRNRVNDILQALGNAVEQPSVAAPVEDYALFEVREFELICPADALPQEYGAFLAQILRAEIQDLSEQEITDALTCRITYGQDDITLIDWNAALVFDREAEDIRSVLEFANVELLELRFLDHQLDASLDRAYELTSRMPGITRWLPGWAVRTMRQISQMQLEGAILFERVSNAPKLLGDQFLARVYRLAAQRFHFSEWNASILRKLDTLEDFYQQLNATAAARRLEVLEWIIIILIALSIIMPFIPGLMPSLH